MLYGNNPRFPWEPSTTMLTDRLDGTTVLSASYRGELPILPHRRQVGAGSRGGRHGPRNLPWSRRARSGGVWAADRLNSPPRGPSLECSDDLSRGVSRSNP